MQAHAGGQTEIFVQWITSIRSGDDRKILASELIDEGLNVLMFDYRTHGALKGNKPYHGFFKSLDVLDISQDTGGLGRTINLLGVFMGTGTVLALAERDSSIRGCSGRQSVG